MRNQEISKFTIVLCATFVFLYWCQCQSYFVQSAIASIHKRREYKELDRIGSPNTKLNAVKNYCVDSDRASDSGFSVLTRKVECSKVTGPIMRIEINAGNYLSLDSGHFIAPSEYCVIDRSIARFNPVSYNYGKLCPTHSDPLWKKCCGESQILDFTTMKCRKSRITFRPKVNDSLQSFVIPANNSKGDFGKSCPPGFVLKVYSKDPCLRDSSGSFQLAPNGTPMYQASTGVFLRKLQLKPVEHDLYCVDGLLDFSSCGSSYNEWKCRREMGEVLLVCMEEQDTFVNEGDEKGVPKAYFLAAIWLSTCPLLLSAAIANSCVIQKNVHGWILTSYLVSMFLVNVNSVVLILDLRSNADGCGLLDFSMKFIYMSTLCWMTSMNFGLWRTFSSSVPQVVAPQRFLLSAVFSIGFPVIAVMASYYAGSTTESNKNEESSTSQDEESNAPATCQRGACALYSYKTLPYYSGPIILLVLCNVGAFLKTSTTIASLRREAEAVLHKQTKDHLESFTLFAKLFLLTGSIWVIRVVLLVLQIQGLYLTWYGVVLEAVFSIPEAVFPMIIFHHPEFIKWTWRKSPKISRILLRCNPFCREDLCKELNSLEMQSGNHLSVQRNTSPTGNNEPIAVA